MKCYPIKCLHSEVSKVFASLKGVNFKDTKERLTVNSLYLALEHY